MKLFAKEMSTKQLALILGGLCVFSGAASEASDVDKNANLFQLCPVSDKGGADRKMYSFDHAIKHRDSDNFSSGWYSEKPVVDFRDLKSVRIDLVEMGAAPFRGIVFSFTDAGYTRACPKTGHFQ
jgi:hypothetical protein